MRKLLFAALLCTSALAMTPAANATGLTAQPGVNGAMLIPTYSTGTATVTPVQYYGHRRHYYRRHHYWRRHYR